MSAGDGGRPGISGRIAQAFLTTEITPLLAFTGLLLGVFAVLVTPREEEPQIDVTFANVFVPYPGASAREVESLITTPAEQIVSEIDGVKHVYSMSTPGMAQLTVRFEVGEPRTEAIVRLYNAFYSNQDWLPRNLGVGQPLIKPKGIDDVPVVAVTLWSEDPAMTAADLARVARTLETELQRVPGTRDIETLGAPERVVKVAFDPERLAGYGLALDDLRRSLAAANASREAGSLLSEGREMLVQAGTFLSTPEAVADLVVGIRDGAPILLRDVATVSAAADQPEQYVSFATGPAAGDAVAGRVPAVTIAVSKKPGENAVTVAAAVIERFEQTRGIHLPDGIATTVTRNYGATAADKAGTLIQKLIFATASVVLLVLLALGWREAAVVGAAVVVTLAATLFASWGWGFTLNRVSLFALIFSIGILVDDAIVVVENIHRHLHMPGAKLLEAIPRAVDEVGGPTILATFTVIAALLPMAFVTGLMGPYMRPIPINASTGMLISLAVAFVFTPWLYRRVFAGRGRGDESADGESRSGDRSYSAGDAYHGPGDAAHGAGDAAHGAGGAAHGAGGAAHGAGGAAHGAGDAVHGAGDAVHGAGDAAAHGAGGAAHDGEDALHRVFRKLMTPFLREHRGRGARWAMLGVLLVLIVGSVGLVAGRAVVMKMLPFDNKSEFQVVVDMPEGTPLEDTHRVLQALADHIETIPEVTDHQLYAGTSAPINFNGLVRQYYLRRAPHQGDIQVNLLDKDARSRQSHTIAAAARPALTKIGQRFGAEVKIVEVPPGPPVLAPLVAEIYGPDHDQALEVAARVREIFAATQEVVDVDTTIEAAQQKLVVSVDRARAAKLGVSQDAAVATVAAALSGEDMSFLHDEHAREPVPIRVELAATEQGEVERLRTLRVRADSGVLVPLSEFASIERSAREQTIHHKDLLPVVYVTGDVAGATDSPLYGMAAIAGTLADVPVAGAPIEQHYVSQPDSPYRWSLKWDGEWQVTYDTFRDMGAAYAVGLVLIYLLVVAQFRSYGVPLVIMAPIPLTLIGIMPGHALLGQPFTAPSMIGMIALAGIIVRNSILLVDFIEQEVRAGRPLQEATIAAAAVRARPIALTAVAAMMGGFFILDDPIFGGLAVSLIFGLFVSTVLTLLVIPLVYYHYHWKSPL